MYADTLVRWGGIGGLFWHDIPDETPLAGVRGDRAVRRRSTGGELDVITLPDLTALQGR